MHSLRRLLPVSSAAPRFFSTRVASFRPPSPSSSSSAATGDDEWNVAWETAWLPDDLSAKQRAPWESDVNFPSSAESTELDPDTKAFVAEMDDRWSERRASRNLQQRSHGLQKQQEQQRPAEQAASAGGRKAGDEYRLRKQRIHAGLWTKEIEKMDESKLGGHGAANDIDRLLDTCSEIFDSVHVDMNDTKIPSTSEFKTKPDGWETTTRTQDGSIWKISQREEDILLQEFERRIAFSKSQIASFIKTHIFSRRRPIDGWKYMIEELGPNARKGKGSVQRLPSLVDPATQPFREDKMTIGPDLTSSRRR